MVDVGDLREGMLPAEVPGFLERAARLEHLDLIGVGTSLTCYGSVVPSAENLGVLATVASGAGRMLGHRLLVSGGSSTSIEVAAAGHAPSAIDNLRIGEAIVLGVDPATRERILGLHTDALTVAAPVIECRVKPSVPIGQLAQDAFGNRPVFEDRGERRRAIVALGRQDVAPSVLEPVDPRVTVLGASSDHLILDVHDLERAPAIGEAIEFVPGYAATLALFTSPYVRKEFRA
jgi:predicted amino acid racemase